MGPEVCYPITMEPWIKAFSPSRGRGDDYAETGHWPLASKMIQKINELDLS